EDGAEDEEAEEREDALVLGHQAPEVAEQPGEVAGRDGVEGKGTVVGRGAGGFGVAGRGGLDVSERRDPAAELALWLIGREGLVELALLAVRAKLPDLLRGERRALEQERGSARGTAGEEVLLWIRRAGGPKPGSPEGEEALELAFPAG